MNRKMKTTGLILSISLLLFSCRKESFINSPDARVTITADTLKYDTVFPTTGSVTQLFKIINENKQKLLLSSIKLMGGSGSAYKMNVDGIATIESTNIEIEANDSVYVFVQVNVNPNAANLPFVLRDSIKVSYNGNDRLVQLEAWGQNAHFLRDKQVVTDETWTNDLPYVILGFLHVNPNTKLTIEKGCRIYIHPDAPIIVDGTLQINGLKDTTDRVYFSGDRLDEPYKDYPASWPGIFFTATSKDNILNYAVIKNSFQSIAVEDPSVNANPKLILNQCIIDNSYDAGIIAVNSSITATNCLISNCGKNIALIKGGTYRFTHCTVATYSNSYINHKSPVLTVLNYDGTNATTPLDAIFRNNIFWGENGLVEDEVVVDKKGTTAFSVIFNQTLWKVKNTPSNISIVNPAPINNQPPLFDSINTSRRYYNFHLQAASPAVNKGTDAGISIDLDGKPRPVGFPDLGCYEK
ncbi:MAG: choice-of-anchor Q domain-containing protein [Chitinophagaceae bacterium]